MKNNNFSHPYRNMSFDKIGAPAPKIKNSPKTSKITSEEGADLRVGGKKK